MEEKDDLLGERLNYDGVCRTAPDKPGRLNISKIAPLSTIFAYQTNKRERLDFFLFFFVVKEFSVLDLH